MQRSDQPGSHHTIVVTGGSTGIGRSICQHLLAEGYAVLNLARRAAAIDWGRRYPKP